MKLLAVLAALPLFIASWALAGEYDGLYRPESPSGAAWDCKTVGMDGGAIAVRQGVFIGVETKCNLTSPVSVRGMQATLFDAGCSGEGETWNERLLIAKSDSGITLLFADGTPSELRLCP